MKERLIGAVVLVTVAWLLIPVFLDGQPDASATVNRPVALPGSAADAETGDDTQRVTIDLRDPQPAVAVTETPFVDSLPAAATTEVVPEDTQAEAESAGAVDVPATETAGPPVAVSDDADTVAVSDGADKVAVVPSEPERETPPADTEAPTTEAEPVVASSDNRTAGQLWAVQLGSFSDAGNAQRLAARFQSRETPTFVRPIQSNGKTLHRVRIGPVETRAAADAIVARLAAQGQAARAVPHP